MNGFEYAVQFVLENEGVFSNDAADRGGRTKFGITEHELIAYQKRTGRFAGVDIRDLAREQAIDIYRDNYWRFVEPIRSRMIATKLFDFCVNMGQEAAAEIAQKALNFVGVGVKVDGLWGPGTRDAINTFTGTDRQRRLLLLKSLVLFAASRYTAIVFGNHSQLTFIDGWIVRLGKRPLD